MITVKIIDSGIISWIAICVRPTIMNSSWLVTMLMANQVEANTIKADSERQTAKKLKNSALPRLTCCQ